MRGEIMVEDLGLGVQGLVLGSRYNFSSSLCL